MFLSLLKIQMAEVGNLMFNGGASKKDKKKKLSDGASKALMIILYILLAVLMGGMFLGISVSMAMFLKEEDYWFYFAVVSMMELILCIVGSVFATYSQLFTGRDNSLLLPMPIPVRYIVSSRMISLIIFNFFISIIVFIPSLVVSLIFMNMTFLGTVIFFLQFLIIPFVSLSISAFISFLCALILSLFNNTVIVKVLGAFAAIGIYLFVYFKFIGTVNDIGDVELSSFAASLRSSIPFTYYIGAAVCKPDFIYFLVFLLISSLVFALSVALICVTFIRIVTTSKNLKKKKYTEKTEKMRSVTLSLLSKELRLFFSSVTYIINSGIGLILMMIISVLLFTKNTSMIASFMGMDETEFLNFGSVMGSIFIMFSMLFISMSPISSVSISLEAKTIWIPKSMPIDQSAPLMAKTLAHIVIALPCTLLSSLFLSLSLKSSIDTTVFVFVLPAIATVFSAFVGTFFNLLMPKFNWTNETMAIKKSISVLVSMMSLMILFFIISIIGIAVSSISSVIMVIYYSLVCVLLSGLTVGIYFYFKHGGKVRFSKL